MNEGFSRRLCFGGVPARPYIGQGSRVTWNPRSVWRVKSYPSTTRVVSIYPDWYKIGTSSYMTYAYKTCPTLHLVHDRTTSGISWPRVWQTSFYLMLKASFHLITFPIYSSFHRCNSSLLRPIYSWYHWTIQCSDPCWHFSNSPLLSFEHPQNILRILSLYLRRLGCGWDILAMNWTLSMESRNPTNMIS